MDIAPRRAAFVLAGLAIATYLLLSAVLFLQILHRNGGHFTYALDDPYIHLALSEGIAHGHYGINAGEFSSPSSSVLWPFLLAIFAHFSWQVYVPLALNLLAGIAAAALIGASVALWPAAPADELRTVERWRRVLSVLALVFIGNLLGLTFIGMEHTLQVLLAGAGAWGILCCLRHRPVPAWVLVCAVVGPMVRYESLGITVALAIALFGQREKRKAGSIVFLAIAPLVLFSLFLHHLGLPWLPTSVLVKGQSRMAVLQKNHPASGGLTAPTPTESPASPFTTSAPGAIPTAAPGMVSTTVTGAIPASNVVPQGTLIGDANKAPPLDPHRVLLAILFFTLAGLAWYERDRERRFALWGSAAAGGLHLVIGRFNWFHRYEVYAVFFCALVVLYVVHERPRGLLGWYVLGLLGCSYLYIGAFFDVPKSAADVYREEYQMHRFATEFYTGNVAVNDLGLVSYHHRPGTYVLDLWGLGSVEAARQHDKSTAWLDAVTRAHHTDLVMNYALWFAPPPPSWRLLGEVCLKELPVALGDPCVNYYATNPVTALDLQGEFDSFAKTVPAGITVRHPLLPPPPPLPAPPAP